MKSRIAFGMSLALLLAGATAVWARVYQVMPAATLTGPPQWVAYEAEFSVTDGSGLLVTTGQRFRSSDGSERVDAQAPNVATTATSIYNIPKSTYFRRSPDGTWQSRPLVFPKAGYRPKTEISLGSRTLASRRRDTVEGIETWESVGGDAATGASMFVAPQLNFLPLRSTERESGQTMQLTNIRLVEPDAALFEPPANATIVASFSPMRMGKFSLSELGPGFARNK
jgi:hypothetical protein